ncbi:hypothetical protein Esti_004134 [Eimeria stiedai]
MDTPPRRRLSGCRCCFHHIGNMKFVSADNLTEGAPVYAAPASSAVSQAGNVTAETTEIDFLVGPNPRDAIEKVPAPGQPQNDEEAAQTALQAVTPVVAGVSATAGLCLVWAAAASMTVTAGAPTCAFVIAGSTLAAVAGLAFSACTATKKTTVNLNDFYLSETSCGGKDSQMASHYKLHAEPFQANQIATQVKRIGAC